MGIWVEFFGREARTMKAPEWLALKTGCAVVPINNYRENGRHHVVIHPALEWIPNDDAAEAIRLNTQSYNDVLERFIRERPASGYGFTAAGNSGACWRNHSRRRMLV